MKNQKPNFIEFIIVVALLMALVSVTINMFLPAFQDVSNEFQLKDKNKIQLTISLLYLGLGVSQLFYGILSDTIGRKPIIYNGLILFILGCIISYVSKDLNILLIGQTLLGIGLGAPRVMSVAIVRDKFEGRKMARAMSFIMVIYVLMPIVSPILGKSIIMISNWRILFVIYIIFSALVFLLFRYRMPETLTLDKQKSFESKHFLKATQEILTNKHTFTYILILGLYSGIFITYLNLSQAIFEFQYQLGNQYPYYFALLACSIGLASFINSKLVLGLGMKLLTKIAILNSLFSALLFFSISYFVSPSLWLFIIFMFIQLFSYGLLVGNLNALAMQPLGHIAGLGASLIGAVSTIISVPMSIFIGSFYNNTTFPIVMAYCCTGIFSILMLNFINQQFFIWKT